LERKGGIWPHIYSIEKTCQSNLLHLMRHERYIVGESVVVIMVTHFEMQYCVDCD
jgi:hypothetical protein